RRLGLQHEPLPAPAGRAAPSRRVVVSIVAVLVLVAASALVWRQARLKHVAADVSTGQVVQTVRAGELQIAILSPAGTLHQGRNTFTIEFRSANGQLVDVGAV